MQKFVPSLGGVLASTFLFLSVVAFLLLCAVDAAGQSPAKDIPIGVTFICSGEHISIENCNIRDTSDASNCMVAHSDHLTPTGLNSYTYMTRGALKKLLPTCQQPTAKQLAAAKAFQQRQQDAYNANVDKAEQQMKTASQPVTFGQPQKPKTPEERQMARCITSGRLPASCTGNSLLGWFSQAINSVVPGLSQKANDAIKASVASAVRADASGNGTFPGVPPGTYYLLISVPYGKQPLVWNQAVQIHAGANSIKLDPNSATPLN